ncbi:MAG: hypothetical protein AB3N16_07935 [Flavobacteriaceae bacterium]
MSAVHNLGHFTVQWIRAVNRYLIKSKEGTPYYTSNFKIVRWEYNRRNQKKE